ncbi:class I SAM-dependent methyltransferase [Streptomyces sp. NPDC127068]|uniref:class I SAM-dependent methyltransferase n=1 Tax=Streptomyces sp. NPDC127068 TaxID=3347127 RepID=UPI0036558C35
MDGKTPGQVRLVTRSLPGVCRSRGVARGLHLGLSELAFDLRNGTDTGVDPPRHEGTNPLVFAELLARLGPEATRGGFLDFGAGKGRALLLAARHGFPVVVGVERSAELCAIAERNVARWLRRRPGPFVEVHHADVRDFPVPDDITVGYLFNPFGPDTVRVAIDRILASLWRAPRPFHVVYAHPRCADLFVGAGFTPVHRQGTDGTVLRHG